MDRLDGRLAKFLGRSRMVEELGFSCVTCRSSVHLQQLNIQQISVSWHAHFYPLSTPLGSEAVNLSTDLTPHNFSVGKSENIYSMFACAEMSQCRTAALLRRQGREAAGQNASCLPLESLWRM